MLYVLTQNEIFYKIDCEKKKYEVVQSGGL